MKQIAEELNDEQLERLDELDNAAYEFALTVAEMAGEYDDDADEEGRLEWDYEYIGEIVDSAVDIMADYLKDSGRKIHYPFIERDSEGPSYAYDYYNEELEDEEAGCEKEGK